VADVLEVQPGAGVAGLHLAAVGPGVALRTEDGEDTRCEARRRRRDDLPA
jgi:hypothetical protein